MVDLDRLGEAADKLSVFDIDEGRWPEESDGFHANAARVFAGLEEDLSERDFTNPLDTEYRVAPNAVIAALRLGRWTGQAEGELSPGLLRVRMLAPTPQEPITAKTLARNAGSVSIQEIAFAEAAATIRVHLSDKVDSGREWYARKDVLFSARRAARLLLYSAALQAEMHDFPLFQAFDARLGELREEQPDRVAIT
jgi:hypothetical protein